MPSIPSHWPVLAISRRPPAADSAPVNGAIELLHVFSPNLVNEAKFGFNRGTAITTDINHTGIPYAVSVSGFTTLNNNRISKGMGNSFSEIDNLTWIKGRHTVKAESRSGAFN